VGADTLKNIVHYLHESSVGQPFFELLLRDFS